MNRREAITLIGSVSSSLSLPISLISVVSADEESSDPNPSEPSVFRTTYVPGMESGKIQEIKGGEEIQHVEVEDKTAWVMHARSFASTVNISLPMFARFTPYKILIEPPYWTISYTNEAGYIIDLYHSRHSPKELKASLFEIASKDKTIIKADDFESLVWDTRQLIQEVIYND